jgi:hypothetical protein
MQAEMIATAYCNVHIDWLRDLISMIGIGIASEGITRCILNNGLNCVTTINSGNFQSNSRRLQLRYHSIDEAIAKGKIEVKHITGMEILAVFPSGQAGLSGGFQMRAGPVGFSGRPGVFSWRTKPKQNILFERFSAAYTKNVSKVRNINHIQLNHRSPAIAVFHPPTRPRLMQANAGFLNHVQAGI